MKTIARSVSVAALLAGMVSFAVPSIAASTTATPPGAPASSVSDSTNHKATPPVTADDAANEVDKTCRTKAPGGFNSVHEYTCAFQLFRASSIVLGDPDKMKQFVSLWSPKLWVNSPELKMDGVKDADRIANTFTLIRRMRDFTHERFDYVEDPEQSKGVQEHMVHPVLKGGIGAIVKLSNQWEIEKALSASIPKDGKITNGDYAKLRADAMVISARHQLVIDSPVQDGPSDGALRSDDIVTAVDGKSIDGLGLDKVVNDLLRGTAGTTLTVTVQRLNKAGTNLPPLDFHLVRSVVDQRTVIIHDVNGIRNITVGNFVNDHLLDDFYNAVVGAQKAGMKGINIDLRGNPGGRLDYVLAMMEMVVPRGLLLSSQERVTGETKKIQTDYVMEDGYGIVAQKTVGDPDSTKQLDAQPRVPYTSQYGEAARVNGHFVNGHPLQVALDESMPITVMINVDSYSASEIFAGAIQATHRGTLIGAPSAGKGAIMGQIPMPEGGSLSITLGQFYPGGVDTKLKGVLPDREVKASEDFGQTDAQKDEAFAVIEEQHAHLEKMKALAAERTKINSDRFESEMKTRDESDLKPIKDQTEQE